MKRIRPYFAVAAVLLGGLVPAASAAPIKVVTTMSTFADLVKTVGGEYVDPAYVASPKFNPHFIEPKPSDVLKVKRAELFVHAGLDLELWRGPLLDAAGNLRLFPGGPGELDLSQGIALLEVPGGAISRSEGDIHLYGNPHYWVDPENARRMAQTICDKLCAIDPPHESAYHRNLEAFIARLDAKIAEWQSRLRPYRGRELIGYHNEWPYLMRFTGLTMRSFLEPKPGIPPTPKQIELIKEQIKAGGIQAIVQSPYLPAEAARSLSKQTGARVAWLCQNVGEVPAASDYIAMTDYNVAQLLEALGS